MASIREVARRLGGVDHQIILRMIAAGTVTKQAAREYSVEQVAVEWIADLRKKNDELRQATTDNSLLAIERRRLATAKADKAELDLALIHGELIPAEAAAAALTGMLTIFKQKLMGLPSSLAPRLAVERQPARIETVVREELNGALGEISRTRVVAEAAKAGAAKAKVDVGDDDDD